MQFARTGVRIVNSRKTMTAENRVKFPNERRQVLRIDRGIFNHRHRFCVSRDVRKQAQGRFTEIPNPVLVRTPDHRIMVTKTGGSQLGFETSRRGRRPPRECRQLARLPE